MGLWMLSLYLSTAYPTLCDQASWFLNSIISECKRLDATSSLDPAVRPCCWSLRTRSRVLGRSLWLQRNPAIGSWDAAYDGPFRRHWPQAIAKVCSSSATHCVLRIAHSHDLQIHVYTYGLPFSVWCRIHCPRDGILVQRERHFKIMGA